MDPIAAAFHKYGRADFVPADIRNMADWDTALPIGYGQTISQPSTVRLMMEWLAPRSGGKVLDVGSGSGWTTALLSHIVGPGGCIFAVERIPELLEFGRSNIERQGIKNASFHLAGKELGLPDFAPFDRILVSASADKLPEELIAQLKPKGKMIVPVHEDMIEIIKKPAGRLEVRKHPEYLFTFVPLL